MKSTLPLILGILIILACAVGISYLVDAVNDATCNRAAVDMGFSAGLYDAQFGCVVEVAPGRWVPIDNYRYQDQ